MFEETRHYNEINRKRNLGKVGFYYEDEGLNESTMYKHMSSDQTISEDELESELTAHVNNNILKVFKSLKSAPAYRKLDPTSLRSRVAMLDSDVCLTLSRENEPESEEIMSQRNIEANCHRIVR